MATPGDLYAEHLTTIKARADETLRRVDRNFLVIASGSLRFQFLDDASYPYKANPHFKAWLPLVDLPDSWIIYRAGERPTLVFFQPVDYWHEVPENPSGYWLEHFDVRVIADASNALKHLPKNEHSLVIGEHDVMPENYRPNATTSDLDFLHYERARKTPYELKLMRLASDRAARAHAAAESCFRNGGSEFEIHLAYVAAAGQSEKNLPYSNIVALNQHCAVLHYQYQRQEKPLQHLSFLIDAGAQEFGYAADVTRTYAAQAGFFADMVAALDAAQLRLCRKVRANVAYPDIHLSAHLEIAGLLKQFGLVRMNAESMVETGVSRVFFPHGIGHFLGLQVHDVGGFMSSDRGGTINKPDGHPYLRLTRTLQPGHVVTIEPGIYFIDMLLKELASGPHSGDVAWSEIDALRHYGGIRIEDNVVATNDEPENLTRNAFAQLS
jgi:Xaa-Pro dipeptidase